jgi:tripartite-type tricarboxylate transporter receptor subunit TctC
MNVSRRRFLPLAAGAAILPVLHSIVRAQAYPSRPVRWIVPFPPGGFADVIVRPISQHLTGALGQPFVIEHRPGAGTNIGTELVARAPSDGYTLLFVGQASAVNATLSAKLNFNFIRDITPVAGMVRIPLLVVVNPSVPVRTVPEIVAYAKAFPGKLSYASAGNGTSSNLAAELFKLMAGVDMLHVPYRGAAPALSDLIGGQVQVMFDNATTSVEHVRSGRLRALAVTSKSGSPVLPDLPPVSDFVPGFEVSAWSGIGAPKDTAPEIVTTLNKAINDGLADARIRTRISELGGTSLAGAPSEFGQLIADETDKWARVIRTANIKPE